MNNRESACICLNSEREGHVLETPHRNLCWKNNFSSPIEELKYLSLKNPDRSICPHLNINSVNFKSALLSGILKTTLMH